MPNDRLTADHAEVLTRSLFRGAAHRGERAVALTRAAVCLVGVAAVPVIFKEDSERGRQVFWGIEAIISTGFFFSLYTLWRIRSRAVSRPFQLLSVSVDSILATLFLLGYVMCPIEKHEGIPYVGIMGRPIFCVLYLAIIAACLRLSRTVAVVGTSISAGGLIVLVVADKMLWGPEVQLMPHVVDAFVLLVGFSLLGLFNVFRLHRLVQEGAGMAIDNERVRSRLGAYVSPEIAELSLLEDEISLGGARKNVAVLFSDVRGFTQYSETLAPEDLVGQLNAYLDAMVGPIRRYGGVVDKYIGDAIMAVFGAPHSNSERDAAQAIRAARALGEALVAHNLDRRQKGLPEFHQGIGVHYGSAVAGNVGTAERAQYTVIGDTVNLASRLETATKDLGVGVVLSADVVDAARRCEDGQPLPELVELQEIAVRGREQRVKVYTFIDREKARTEAEREAGEVAGAE